METKNLTIVFIDLAGFTTRTSHIPRDKLIELIDRYEGLVVPTIQEFNGAVIKKIGDAFMAVFESPTDAILCGVKVQQTLFEYNKNAKPVDQIRVRIAINTGEVNIKDNDVYGEAVNIASRLEKVSRPNDVYFTDAVYLSMSKAEIPSIFIGKKQFKGIPRKIGVYKVLGEYNKILLARKRKKKQSEKRRRRFRLIMFAIFVLLLILILLYFYQNYLQLL